MKLGSIFDLFGDPETSVRAGGFVEPRLEHELPHELRAVNRTRVNAHVLAVLRPA